MASRYFGVDRGGQLKDITDDSSTTSKDVELAVDLAASMERQEVLVMLEQIRDYILAKNWPPA